MMRRRVLKGERRAYRSSELEVNPAHLDERSSCRPDLLFSWREKDKRGSSAHEEDNRILDWASHYAKSEGEK